MAVSWLEKRYTAETDKMFENRQGRCCSNNQVTKVVDWMEYFDNNGNEEEKIKLEEKLGAQMSLIHIYFKELEVVKYSKQENYGTMDLIGRCKI